LFQLEQEIRKTYSYEIELIVMLQMLLV
jgi:hypothetical protein